MLKLSSLHHFRYGHAAVTICEDVYLWGGRNDADGACNKVFQFNTGIKVKEIDQIISQYLRLDSTEGMLVIDVENKSSGQAAGVKIGDVILEVNSVKIQALNDIKRIINENLLKTGDQIQLKILRNNYEYELNLPLEKGGF